MPIKRLKNISVRSKFLIIGTLSVLFLIIFSSIYIYSKKQINTELQYLQTQYLKKNKTIYNIQVTLNSFIIQHYLAFEKLESINKIQNDFYIVNDSINFYQNKYSTLITNIDENKIFDEFELNYQKFQSTVYEILNQYKQDEIKYNLVKKYIDDELYIYRELTENLNKLKSINDKNYLKSLNEINQRIKKNLIINIISLIIFLSIMLYLTAIMFVSTLKTPEKIKKYLEKINKNGIIEKLPDENEINILIDDIKNLNQINKNIKNAIDNLTQDKLEISFDNPKNQIYLSIKNLTNKLQNIQNQIEAKKAEDEQKEWANKGQTLFADLLRRYSNDLQKLSDEVLKNIVKYLDAAVGGMFIVQEKDQTQYLELVSAFAYDRKKFFSKHVEFGEGLVGTVAVDKSLLFLNKIPDDYLQIEAGLGDAPPNSLLIIPLLSDSGLMGVLEIASFKILQQFEIDFAKDLSHSIASTIESVKINERTKQLLEESRKQSEELARREKILQETFEEVAKAHEAAKRNEIELRGILTGVDQTLLRAEYTPEGIFLDSNIVHRRVMGYNIDWMRGKSIFEFIPDEEKEEFDKMWHEIASGKPKQVTVRRQNKQTGQIVWLLNNYTPIFNEEKQVVKILYLAIDITEQKKAEEETHKLLEETRKKEIELRGILAGIDRTILRAEYKPDGTFVDANEIHTQVLGYRKESMIGKSILEFVDPEEHENFKKNIWNKVSRGQALEITVKRTNKATGRDIWLINQYNPILDENNKVIRILYLAIDITKQKLVEEAAQQLLAETQKKEIELRGVLAGIDRTILRAEYSPDGILLDANEIHQEILGYDIEKMRGKSILQFIETEEDKENFKKLWEEVKSGIAKELTVKRLNKSTGDEIWLINQYNPILDENGEIYKILYLAIDITEQKQAEEKINALLQEVKENEFRLRGIISGVDRTILRAEYTPDGILLDANEIHQKILGYDINNMRGQSILQFIDTDEEKENFKKFWEEIKNGQAKELTVKRINKSTGEDIWLINQYIPILDEKNNVESILYLAIDITENKKNEELVTELLAESEKRELELLGVLNAIDHSILRAEYAPDGTFLDSNHIHQEILGYQKEEMVGKSIFDFVTNEEKEVFEDLWKNVISGKFQELTVKRINFATGEDIWLTTYYSPILDENNNVQKILYLAINVTEHKLLEYFTQDMLEESQRNELELTTQLSVFDQKVGRCLFDNEWNLIETNELISQIFNFEEIAMIGHNIFNFYPKQWHQHIKNIQEQIQELETVKLELNLNDDKYFEVYFIPILDDEGNLYKIANILFDITNSKITGKPQNYDKKLKEELENFEKLKKDISKKFDTDTDKLYDDWLNSFE